jgi:hypothetical protein
MRCQERSDLAAEYQAAVSAYTDAVARLREHTLAIPQIEYELLWKMAEVCRKQSQEAYRRLAGHIGEHGC